MRTQTRTCERCGRDLETGTAAHECSHGKPCRHRADWKTPDCEECCSDAQLAVPHFELTVSPTPFLTDAEVRAEAKRKELETKKRVREARAQMRVAGE